MDHFPAKQELCAPLALVNSQLFRSFLDRFSKNLSLRKMRPFVEGQTYLWGIELLWLYKRQF